MPREPIDTDRQHADALRSAVIGGAGTTPAALLAAVLDRAANGPAIEEPYDALAQQIGEAAFKVTDAQVAAVRAAAGTDKAAFEVVMSACIGSGLARWDAAARAIGEAGDATA